MIYDMDGSSGMALSLGFSKKSTASKYNPSCLFESKSMGFDSPLTDTQRNCVEHEECESIWSHNYKNWPCFGKYEENHRFRVQSDSSIFTVSSAIR